MRDRDWIVPSIAITMLSGAIAMLLIPSYTGIMAAVGVVPYWMIAAAMIAGIYGFCVMAAAGEKAPVKRIRETIIEDWRGFALGAFGIFIAALNMTTFMWTKPLLNYLVPFWADPLLADLDYWLFFGNDPWVFLTWLNTSAMTLFYHRGWIVMMILTLLIVLSAPPSAKKSAMMLTYFLLWSVVGPVLHILLPATGPIFYADMGYGDRFAGLRAVSDTREIADYLWTIYSNRGFGAGAGISAMPSLHITTTVWMIMAIRIFKPRLMIPMVMAAILTFLLSIALGWHYAVDGIVGGVVAWLCYLAMYAIYDRNRGWSRKPAVAVS